MRLKVWPSPPREADKIPEWARSLYIALSENSVATVTDVAADITAGTVGVYTPIAHKTTEDALNGLVKVNGAGVYSAVADNSTNWNIAYSWGNWAHTTLSGYGITDAAPLAHKTTEDAVNGLVFVNGAGVYSAKVIGTDVAAQSHASQHAGAGSDPVATLGTLLSTTVSINAKTVATTKIYTVPASKKLIPLWMIIQCTAFTSGGKSIQAVAQAGGNAATYNDLFAAGTITISAVDQYNRLGTPAPCPMYGAGSDIYINITTGSDATTETWSILLVGLLV